MAAKFVMEAVVAAVIQEGVSRGVSVLGKRKEKASQGELLDERLETAVHTISLVFERAAKLPPVTEVSLLRRWAKLKREYMDATNLLGKLHKKRQEQPQQDTGQVLVTHTSSSSSRPGHHGRRRLVHPARLLSFVSSFVGRLRASEDDESLCLSRKTVERFERLAVSAREFLADVQSGCSLRCQMIFSGPLVSDLLDGKILLCEMPKGSRQQQHMVLCPVRLQERGAEASLHYVYTDGESREKSFDLYMMLRLRESTDIIQVATKCLESLESQCKLVLKPLIGELILLAGSPDITAHLNFLCPCTPWASIQEDHTQRTQLYRPDPVCCSASCLREPCANDMASSEFSKMFPEEVIHFAFRCSVPSILPDHSLLPPGRSSSDEAGTSVVMRDRPPLLRLLTEFVPHLTPPPPLQPVLVEGLQKEGIPFQELVGGPTGPKSPAKCSIQQAAELSIVSLFHLQNINTLIRSFDRIRLGDDGPHLGRELPTCYKVEWFSKHGAAFFRGDIKGGRRRRMPRRPRRQPMAWKMN